MATAAAMGADPLIAEAKERARRRRLLALAAVALVAVAAAGSTYSLRLSASSPGVCVTPPSGWKVRTIAAQSAFPKRVPGVVLTNFRFGRMDNFYGLDSVAGNWPRGGVMIAVQTFPTKRQSPRQALRVAASDFIRSPELIAAGLHPRPLAEAWVTSDGQSLTAFVEVGSVTPATVVLTNDVLASVRSCSR